MKDLVDFDFNAVKSTTLIYPKSKVTVEAVKVNGESFGPWGPWAFDARVVKQLQRRRHPHPRQLRSQALRISTSK